MQRFRFTPENGHTITQFGSQHATHRMLQRADQQARVDLIQLGAGGLLGRHPAHSNQLFLVVSGRGRVQGDDETWHDIQAGEAAYWRAGEHHTTMTEKGLTAIIIEGPNLDPNGVITALPTLSK